jgi:hypothetical protein
VPPAAERTRPAAARRAHQPPRRRVGRWLERFLQDYAGTVVAITHDRYFLDNVAKWILELDRGRGIPFEGNYSSWLEQKQERLARRRSRNEARKRTLERELEWVRMSPKARQAKGKARLGRLRQAARRSPRPPSAGPTSWRSHPRRASASATGHRGAEPAQGLRRQAAHRGPVVLAAQGRHRRHHRPQRRRQDHAVQDAHRPGAARRRHDHRRRHRASSPTSTRAATASTTTPRCTRRSPAASTT